jgi:hypothetical protein
MCSHYHKNTLIYSYFISIVACRLVTSNDRETNSERNSKTTLAARQQILNKLQQRRTVFSERSVQSCYNKDSLEQQLSVMGYSPDNNDVSTEAEQSPLLRSVTGK